MYTFQQASPNFVQKMHQEDFGQHKPAFSRDRAHRGCKRFAVPQLTAARGRFPAHKEGGRLGEEPQSREEKELPCLENNNSCSKIAEALLR